METIWDEGRIGPNSSGLKEPATWRESGGREQKRGEELERGDSCVNRRVRNEHQLSLLFLADFDNKVPWPSLTSALISLVLM